MADTLQEKVRSIFLAAVEDHAPEQWDEYLGTACRGEPELRRRVEFLLRGHQQPNELLDNASAAPVPPSGQTIGEGPGTEIGAYKLLEQIGEGGFGVVFMAEQQRPVRRKVALKIVKPGMDTKQVVARFEAERQALALMDHPNIAQVFDGGATESGRPYFVMELVRGIPITEFCDQNHLTVRERLQLFAQVCLAVQHAHQKGIIHRDLKPNNVMVTQHDVTPVVKIIDFGIAKATGQQLTDKTLFTNFAQFIGTPMYMSPEQAHMSGLDVDTRSDVYSLGVLLYELMTGSPPFDKERLRTAAYDELIRIIREEEPVRPSTRISTLGGAANTAPIDRNSTPKQLSQLFRGELDWIVMKALEKDRNRRYESASALAHDVQRFLDGEMVQACPPTVGYRLKKLARRHKAALATAAIVFAALAVGTTVAIWQAIVATQAKQQAVVAAVEEKKAKEAALAREAESKAVVDFMLNKVIAAAQPEGKGGGLGHDVTLRNAIEAAVPFVQESFKDQPLIEARLRMMLGHSFAALGESKKSRDQFVAAREIFSKLLGPFHELTLRCDVELIWTYNSASRFAEARELGEATLAQVRSKLGPEHPVAADAMGYLASSYDGLGQFDEGLKMREGVLEIWKKTLGPEDPKTIQALLRLGASYGYLDRHAEALEVEEKALAIRLARLGPDHLDTLDSKMSVGVTYQSLGRFREACAIHEDLLPRQKIKLAVDHPTTLLTMCNLATCYEALGRAADAVPLHEQAVALSKTKLGPDHTLTLARIRSLSYGYRFMGRWDEAIDLCKEALRLHQGRFGPDDGKTLQSMHDLALCYEAAGRYQDAYRVGEETWRRRKAVLGANDPSTLWSLNNLGMFHSHLGRHAEALAVHQETLALRTARLGPTHFDTLNSLQNVARSLIRLDRGAEAVPIIDDCIQRSLSVKLHSRFIAILMSLRMQHFVKSKDIAGCQATAAMWDTFGRNDALICYDAACNHAIVAQMLHARDQTPASENQANAEADVAMDWLHKAVAAGFRDTAHLEKDDDLDVLRKRPDFIKLMAELATEANKHAN